MVEIVHHKGVEHCITTDAPFVGARICAIECSNNCRGCFNQHMRQAPVITEPIERLLDAVSSVELNKGIILGGLEWTEQPIEMWLLIRAALRRGMQVILYTHLPLAVLLHKFPKLKGLSMYAKCGGYFEGEESYFDQKFDVVLASKNQKIYKLDELD